MFVKICIWALIVLTAPVVALPRGHTGNDRPNPKEASLQPARSRVVERLLLQIAADYLSSKKKPLPQNVDSLLELEKYLARLYPDPKHELRTALAQLTEHSRRVFSAGEAHQVREHLYEGVKRYARNLRGEPFPYDKERVATIIDEAAGPRRDIPVQPLSPNDDSLRPVETPVSVWAAVTGFVRRQSLTLVGALMLTNLVTLSLMLRMRYSKGEQAREGSRPTTKTPLVEAEHRSGMKVINPDSVGPPVSAESELPQSEPRPFKPRVIPEPDVNDAVAHVGSEWIVVRASVQGRLHVENEPPIPCQDSNAYQPLTNGWGIAVVCDGAGSKKFSHLGARFVAEHAAAGFAAVAEKHRWTDQTRLPSDDEWQTAAKLMFDDLKSQLEIKAATEYQVEPGLLSCTVIVLVHSPFGILTSHIGDGRAAFADRSHQWQSVITPQKGEEANQTIFLTSLDTSSPNGNLESNVCREEPYAFTLMSDGCESHSFEVNVFDETQGKYFDPNRPYEKFFNPLIGTLEGFHKSKTTPEEIKRKWVKFITAGTEKLKHEADDKTMILGVRVN